MSRFELGGHEGPIPSIALPDPNLSDDMPVQQLELVDGIPFQKADWVALGYTHFEVWCVGAAGGRGASIADPIFNYTILLNQVMPIAEWNASMAAQAYWDTQSNPPENFDEVSWRYQYQEPGNPNYPPGGVPGNDYGWPHSHRQWIEHNNPNHYATVELIHTGKYQPGDWLGGAGGGGGLHVVGGELADLPDSVPITVGQPGTNTPPGQGRVNGGFVYNPLTNYGPASWRLRYVGDPLTPVYPPGPGGDGGASTFGDIAQASGGKGGHPIVKWVGATLVYDGVGGDGGAGGRTVAGGGAKGGITGNGADGGWDGTVGQGGGGGRYGLPAISQVHSFLVSSGG